MVSNFWDLSKTKIHISKLLSLSSSSYITYSPSHLYFDPHIAPPTKHKSNFNEDMYTVCLRFMFAYGLFIYSRGVNFDEKTNTSTLRAKKKTFYLRNEMKMEKCQEKKRIEPGNIQFFHFI